jgi:hypothetical protein
MPTLTQLLIDLLVGLVQIRDGPDPGVSLDGPPLERWEDEQFIYLEAHVTGHSDPYIDICIQGRQVYIQMGRPLDGQADVPPVIGRVGRERLS